MVVPLYMVTKNMKSNAKNTLLKPPPSQKDIMDLARKVATKCMKDPELMEMIIKKLKSRHGLKWPRSSGNPGKLWTQLMRRGPMSQQ